MKEYRNKIDKIDSELKKLLNERFEVVRDIGLYKRKNNMEIESIDREIEILNTIEGEFSKYIKNIYKEIFRESKEMQANLWNMDS